MIRIRRTAEPAGHAARAIAKLAELRAKVAANGGVAKRAYLDDAYKHPDVRNALWAMQHEKCAYCEQDREIAWEPVEHYRPFTLYWWLAYEWRNLLLTCNPCNSASKNGAFPLRVESARLAAEQQPPGNEKPLIIDPTSVDPAKHLTFVPDRNGGWIVAPVNNSLRGRKTRDLCRLNRATLARLRNKYAPHFEAVRDRYRDAKARNDAQTEAACIADKARMTADNQHFALLARVILADVP